MDSGASDENNPALRTIFGRVFDKLVDESFDGAEAAIYAAACADLLDRLFPGIVSVTEIEHPGLSSNE